MRKGKCYNAGKISGMSRCQVFAKFKGANFMIHDLGYSIVDPLNDGLRFSAPWIFHIVVDICLLLRCKAVFFQKDWQQSRGARIEHWVALHTGKLLIYEQDDNKTTKGYLPLCSRFASFLRNSATLFGCYKLKQSK